MKKKWIGLSITMSKEMREELSRLAKKQDRSRSALVRILLVNYLKEHGRNISNSRSDV